MEGACGMGLIKSPINEIVLACARKEVISR